MPLGALGWVDMRNDTAEQKLANRSGKIPVQSKDAPDSHRRNHSDDNIKSMVKIVPILECFSTVDRRLPVAEVVKRTGLPRATRSEEHTSELQSRQYLVCRLLLAK